MTVALWPTQPCVAVTPDSTCRCAKDTWLQMPGKEHEARPLVNKSIMVFRLSGNPLKGREFLEDWGHHLTKWNSQSVLILHLFTKCIIFYDSLQIDLSITHFIPSIRFCS